MKISSITKLVALVSVSSIIFFACNSANNKSNDNAQKTADTTAAVKSPAPAATPAAAPAATTSATASADQLAKGEAVFKKTCIACHQATGLGVPGAFPPLANSDYLNADKTRAIHQVLTGSSHKITVDGKVFTGTMPPQGATLSDDDIANVLTYVYHSWGNKGYVITTDDVKAERAKIKNGGK